jgi:DNA-binding CsgD family transcriptional regulator
VTPPPGSHEPGGGSRRIDPTVAAAVLIGARPGGSARASGVYPNPLNPLTANKLARFGEPAAGDAYEGDAMPRRATVIVELARQGKTLTEIGRMLGLSGERVRQLLKEAGHTTRELRPDPAALADKRHGAQVMALWRERRLSDKEIAAQLGLSAARVKAIRKRRASPGEEAERAARSAAAVMRSRGSRISDESGLEALRVVAKRDGRRPGEGLSAPAYDRLRDPSMPSRAWLVDRFGTWNWALLRAGLSGRTRATPRKFSDDQLLGGVRRVAAQLGYCPSAAEYRARYRKGREPGPDLLLKRLRGWIAVRDALKREQGGQRVTVEQTDHGHDASTNAQVGAVDKDEVERKS